MSWRHWLQRRDRQERELDAELRDHLERLTVDLVAPGMTEREARRTRFSRPCVAHSGSDGRLVPPTT
jgi:hypothetical protein